MAGHKKQKDKITLKIRAGRAWRGPVEMVTHAMLFAPAASFLGKREIGVLLQDKTAQNYPAPLK